jgi:hypothetical protein
MHSILKTIIDEIYIFEAKGYVSYILSGLFIDGTVYKLNSVWIVYRGCAKENTGEDEREDERS